MLNPASILSRLDIERRHLAYEGTELHRLPHLTRWRSTDGTLHGVNGTSLTEATADEAIDAEVQHFASSKVPFEWKVYSHEEPGDLRDRLQQRGFEIGPLEAVMICDLAHRDLWPAGSEDIAVQPVERLPDIEVFRRTAGDIFGKDYGFTAAQLAAGLLAGSREHRGYVAFVKGVPAGVSRLYVHRDSQFGGLYGGGTLPAFRGQGVYRAMIARRARDAVAAGAKYLIVDALPTSRPILERLGFTHIADTWPCTWSPAS